MPFLFPVKIAVVGCGAVGSYYGARLCQTGAEVHFLLRSDYQAVRQRGVQIRSWQGDFHVHPAAAAQPQAIGVSDLVLIGLKTTANDQFARLLPPLVGPATAVLTLQNGLGNEEQLARLFSPDQVLGVLCFVCLNRIEPGLIHHLDHGQITLGEFHGTARPRTHQIAELFRRVGVPCQVTEDLARSRWEKLVWNIPFNGLGVASAAGYEAVAAGLLPPGSAVGSCLTTDLLLADPRWEQLLRELMQEVIGAARRLGFDLAESLMDKLLAHTRTMGAYRPSTLIDFEHGLPLELESLFLEPLRRARQGNVSVPRLEALCRVLEALDQR